MLYCGVLKYTSIGSTTNHVAAIRLAAIIFRRYFTAYFMVHFFRSQRTQSVSFICLSAVFRLCHPIRYARSSTGTSARTSYKTLFNDTNRVFCRSAYLAENCGNRSWSHPLTRVLYYSHVPVMRQAPKYSVS